jgi:hypothetical protein
MPPPSWAPKNSKQHKWLEAQRDDYLAAQDGGKIKEWLSDVLRRYFEAFHWSVPDSANPESYPITDLNDYDSDNSDLEQLSAVQASIHEVKLKVCPFLLRFDFMSLTKY